MPRLRHARRFEALSAGAFVFRDNCAWLVGRHTPALHVRRLRRPGTTTVRPRAATHPAYHAPSARRRVPTSPARECGKPDNVRRCGRLPRRPTEVREVRSDLRTGPRGPDCGSGRSLPAATRACICWRAGSAGWEPPTSAVLVVCTGAYLLRVDRRRCAAFVLGGLPFLVRPPPRIRAERGSGRRYRRRIPPTCGRAPGRRAFQAC